MVGLFSYVDLDPPRESQRPGVESEGPQKRSQKARELVQGVTCKETGHVLLKSQEAHEGVQNTPPHDKPLLHVDYFELKLTKTLKVQETLLPLPQLPRRI